MTARPRPGTPELLSLPLHCASCGQPFAVKIVRVSLSFSRALAQFWDCPSCRRANVMKFEGKILGVSHLPALPPAE